MNVNNTLIGMSEQQDISLPVEQDVYTGPEESYITFNYADEREERFMDDEATAEIVYMQIHLFMPILQNHFLKKEAIRSYLKSNGFLGITIQTFTETDTQMRHVLFECTKQEKKGD